MTVELKDLNGVINWIKEYFDNVGIQKAVVGLSGGIDSAVIASLCCRALGQENVIGVIMPCYSQIIDEKLAYKLIKSLQLNNILSLDLEETFDKFWSLYRAETSYGNIFPDIRPALVEANIKARLRMTALYAIAGHVNGLVVGTTNKTEALLGYATKYGDGGVDIEPIQDFYKGEVYELADILGNIPKEIIIRTPSAGLWDGQTDEGELGMTYKEIDEWLEKREGSIANSEHKQIKIEMLIKLNKHKDLHLPFFKREK